MLWWLLVLLTGSSHAGLACLNITLYTSCGAGWGNVVFIIGVTNASHTSNVQYSVTSEPVRINLCPNVTSVVMLTAKPGSLAPVDMTQVRHFNKFSSLKNNYSINLN
jgi:hypothetical protein